MNNYVHPIKITAYRCFVCGMWHKRHSKKGEVHWEQSNINLDKHPEWSHLGYEQLRAKLASPSKRISA